MCYVDKIVLNVCKAENKMWSHITEIEKRADDAKKAKFDMKKNSDDPSESLMGMMKQMYESGDDETKKMIAKAWTESREKRTEL